MASRRSPTLENEPRRRRRSVSSLNHLSIRFSHEELVGVKCRCQRLRLECASQRVTSGDLWADRLSNTTDLEVRGHIGVDQLEEGQHVGALMMLTAGMDHFPGAHVQRREQIDGPIAAVV